jgi:hypothetical protein
MRRKAHNVQSRVWLVSAVLGQGENHLFTCEDVVSLAWSNLSTYKAIVELKYEYRKKKDFRMYINVAAYDKLPHQLTGLNSVNDD